MAAWFSKVFKSDDPTKQDVKESKPMQTVVSDEMIDVVDGDDSEEEVPEPRRVVNAPMLVDESEVSGFSEDIRIKAKLDPDGYTFVFMVDRPVFDGFSFVAPDRDTANQFSPLAAAIFDLGNIASVLIHNLTVTVHRENAGAKPAEEAAKEIGAQIRAHLKSGLPVIDPGYTDQMPSEEEIRAGLQKVLDREINPGIASHSGFITLNRLEGNTAYITMGGGCQGCAASSLTLRQGVESAFRQEVPFLGALLDETDHTAGINPFFKELPAGMGG